MKCSIILLLFLLIAANVDIIDISDDFTIDTFLNYLQSFGYYKVFDEVKCKFGDDVAIELCRLFTRSPHCEEVLRVYMPKCSGEGPDNGNFCYIKEFIYKEENLEIFQKEHKQKEIEKITNILEDKFKCEKWLGKNEGKILLLILLVIIY